MQTHIHVTIRYHQTPLAEDLRAADLELLVPLYANETTLYGPVVWSAHLMNLYLEWGTSWVYFP